MAEESVTIVVDPDFGAKLQAAASVHPVWIAHTDQNRAEAERLWASGAQGITTFVVTQPFNTEEAAVRVLSQVLMHHPRARELRVIGCSPSPLVREAFAEEGFQITEESDGGFVGRHEAVA